MLPLIPEKLDDWDNKTLNSLVVLNDIESERFDFKALEFSKLYDDICGMANTSGGHLVLGVVEVKNEKGQFLEFKKEGFDKGQKRKIENGINSAIAQVEPSPSTAEWRNIEDEGNVISSHKD